MVFPPELSCVATHLPNSPYHSQPAAWGCSPVRTWEQSGGPQEAGGRMEDPPGHMGSEARQRVEGTCPGSQGWGSLSGACGLWVQICVIFTLLCPIILNSQCKLLITQSRPLESNCHLVQLHFKKDFRPRIHLLSNFPLFTALFF